MSTRIDHAAEAEKWLAYSADLNPVVDWPRVSHASILAAGHAALAGVEQQRIANLIELLRVEAENKSTPTDALDALYEREYDYGLGDSVKLHTRPEIKEALRL